MPPLQGSYGWPPLPGASRRAFESRPSGAFGESFRTSSQSYYLGDWLCHAAAVQGTGETICEGTIPALKCHFYFTHAKLHNHGILVARLRSVAKWPER